MLNYQLKLPKNDIRNLIFLKLNFFDKKEEKRICPSVTFNQI